MKRLFAIAAAALYIASPASAQVVDAAGCVVVGEGPGAGTLTCTYVALNRGGVVAATPNSWDVRSTTGFLFAEGTGPGAASVRSVPGQTVVVRLKTGCVQGTCGTFGIVQAGF